MTNGCDIVERCGGGGGKNLGKIFKILKGNFFLKKMTGKVDIVWRIKKKVQKKFEIKSQDLKNVVFGNLI